MEWRDLPAGERVTHTAHVQPFLRSVKLQLNPNFSNPRGKRKLVRKVGYFEKSGVTKITVSDGGKGSEFWFELSGGSKTRDSTVAGAHFPPVSISLETLHILGPRSIA